MGKKRKRGNRKDSSSKDSPASKRSHFNNRYDDQDENKATRSGFATAFANAKGYLDPITGQRGAFPGLDGYGNDFFCGPALDGVDYLRMVRSEARGVPLLLVATPRSAQATSAKPTDKSEQFGSDDDDNGEYGEIGGNVIEEKYEDDIDYSLSAVPDEEEIEDTRCFFEDGTYTATATCIFPQRPPSPRRAALLKWHDNFVAKFRRLHDVFHNSKIKETSLSASTPSSLYEANIVQPSQSVPRKQEDWLHLFRTTSPTPTFLWRLDQPTVLKLIKIQTLALPCGKNIPIEQTRWLYGLLLRCSPLLTSEDLYVLRELARRAIKVQNKLEKTRELAEQRLTERVTGDFETNGNTTKRQRTNGKAQEELEDETVWELHGDDVNLEVEKVGKENGAQLELETETRPSSDIEAQESHESDKVEEGEVEKKDDCDIDSKAGDGSFSGEIRDLDADKRYNVSDITSPNTDQVQYNRLHKRRKNRTLRTGEYDYVPSSNTLGTLDMIISIVGDIYGQRDLLEERVYLNYEADVAGI